MEFLKKLGNIEKFEFSDLSNNYSLDQALKINKNIFFLGEVEPRTSGLRKTGDNSIIAKKYFVVDLDIRKDLKLSGFECSTEDIKNFATQISEDIENNEYLSEWCYIVLSGNGLHVYYSGDYTTTDPKTYKAGVTRIYEKFQKVFEDKYAGERKIKTDTSTANIARILRLPGTINQKKGMEAIQTEILMTQDKHSRLVGMIEALGQKQLIEEEKRDNIKKMTEKQNRTVKRTASKTTTEDIVSQIGEKDIEEILDICGVSYSNERLYDSGRHTNGWRVNKNQNYVINFNEGTDRADGGPFSFVMKHYKYDIGETIKRFCDKYPDIKEMVDKEQIEFRKEKEIDNQEKRSQEIKDNFTHISYKDKLQKSIEELRKTDPAKIIKWGWEERDNILGGIYKGKIYTIGAESGTGKTTFVNSVVSQVSKQGWSVVRYSLEDRMEDNGKEELFDVVNKLRKKDGLTTYRWTKFVNNEYNDKEFRCYIEKAYKTLSELDIVELDKKKTVTIDDLVELMEEACDKGADMFVIDHLHYFDMKGDERHDLQIQATMQRINEVARKRNVAVFLVAHYRNTTGDGNPSTSWFKDGASIKQVSNIIIQIVRDIENVSIFHLTKVRGRIKRDREFRCEFDIDTGEYSFEKTKRQKQIEGKGF